jgi:outer membrane protein OmpA-like peptidoglycan-associated protein
MRCNWRRWLWGVIPLVALALAAVHLERAAIEQDLTDRAQKALAAKGAQWAVVDFTGRDVTLKGSATADHEPREAVAVLRELWGVGRVKSEAGLPKLVEPYVWGARRRGGRVRLSGHYPTPAMKQTIIGMTKAAVPGLDLLSRMSTARGVPPTDTWLAGVSFALKQLAALKRGDVRLEGLALTISGEAENAEAYKLVTAALKRGLPKGITLASVEIAAPVVSPFTWSAEFAGGQLVASGHVPSEAARADLLAAARTVAGTDVVDRMEVARGSPSGAAEAAAVLIKAIVRLQSGSAEMKDAAVVVGGVAADEAQAQAVREALRTSLPAAFKLTDQIRLREPKVEAKPKPAEVPKVETKPAEVPKVETKPVEEPKVEVKPAEPTAETKSAEAAKVAEPKSAEPKVPASGDAQPKDTALLTPPPSAPQPPPDEKPAAPESAPAPPQAKAAPADETKPKAETPPPKAEAAPPPKAEAAPPPKAEPPPTVDLAACRGDIARLVADNPVLFKRGSAQLEHDGLEALGAIAQALKACPGVHIVAEGHADIEGSAEYNQRLSLKRAQVVKDYMIEAGVAADAIETAGFGTTRPVASNTTAQTRAKNRRTEILIRP